MPDTLEKRPSQVAQPRLSSANLRDRSQLVAFGTSGHRGSFLHGAFNEAHILANAQAICEYRFKPLGSGNQSAGGTAAYGPWVSGALSSLVVAIPKDREARGSPL
jgi:hypothetical protein